MTVRRLLAGACASAVLLAGCAATPGASESAPPTAAAPTQSGTPSAPVTTAPPSAAPPSAAPPTVRATPSRTQPAELRVTSVSNFRDVAGTGAGLALTDGGHMARGVVYRSGKLQPLSASDKRKLIAVGITDVFDLRTDQVARRSPDPTVRGAEYHLINVYGVYSRTDPIVASAAEAKAARQGMYRDFVADSKQRKRIGTLLRGIADARGPAIIHCTEGKDRTGWASAMLQLIAGVDQTTVMKEYLLSNERRAAIVDRAVAQARRANGDKAAEIIRARLTVDKSYLNAGLDELTTRYGHLHGYLGKGLGLSEQTIDALRAKLRTA